MPQAEAAFCLAISIDEIVARQVRVSGDERLHLRFSHSIYGSTVEEIFTIAPDGFTLTQLRYGEARLADFYGYEQAQFENGAWVVTPAPLFLPTIHLRASNDAAGVVDVLDAGLDHFRVAVDGPHDLGALLEVGADPGEL